jgi:tetratricopeptide (TPR) repeat protein
MLITAATGTALTAALPGATRPTVGTADVQRLRAELSGLVLTDDREGGGPALETRAVTLGAQTIDLQQRGTASSRVRGHLYALAAEFTATAMFAAIDARRHSAAQRYMDSAMTLAGLSGDGHVQHQTWRYAAMLARQCGRHADAAAAAEAALSTSAHRADPLYASLGHAHLALSMEAAGERARAMRALGRAADAFDRADPAAPRPASMSFYTRGELDGLTGITHLRLHQAEQAEYHLHRCLAALRPDQHRNRALYTAYLALAQLEQDELERACATASAVAVPAGSSRTSRTWHKLQIFTARLTNKAPGSQITRAWVERARTV